MSAFEEFTAARENNLLEINKLNDEINVNRANHAAALARFDACAAGNDAAGETTAREECETLDRELAWLQRKIAIKSKDGGRGDPVVVNAGKRVIAEGRAAMGEHDARWAHVAGELAKHRAAEMELIAELGKIDREARKIRTQCETVFAATGINAPWVASPADRAVNLDKQTGAIYVDHKKITQTFKRGKVVK